MLLKPVARLAALVDGEVPKLPSAPPTTSTAMVLRHDASAAMSRVASVFTSLTRFASGASCWLEVLLPAGRMAPAVVNDLLRIVTMSVFAVETSACTLATGLGAVAFQLPLGDATERRPRVTFQYPGRPVSL